MKYFFVVNENGKYNNLGSVFSIESEILTDCLDLVLGDSNSLLVSFTNEESKTEYTPLIKNKSTNIEENSKLIN